MAASGGEREAGLVAVVGRRAPASGVGVCDAGWFGFEGSADGVEFARKRRLDAQERSEGWAADNHPSTKADGGEFTAGHEFVGGGAADPQEFGCFGDGVDETKFTCNHCDLRNRSNDACHK
jgi:hypothetical protein